MSETLAALLRRTHEILRGPEPCGPCATCRSFGLCAADCSLAPWNDEPARFPAPSRFAYLVRQRRWLGWPGPRSALFFMADRFYGRS
jgi:hypothetical protein